MANGNGKGNGTGTCTIPDCDQPVKYHHLQVCSACYSGLARWRGRPAAQKKKHLERCHRLVSRMGFVIDNPKHHPKRMTRRDDLDRGRQK